MIFKISEFNRIFFLNLFKELTPGQLFCIPKGYKNNIIWNIGHVLITEQMLTYGLSGLNISVDKKFIKKYGKGSTPSTIISQKDIEAIKTILIPAIQKTKTDLNNNIFTTYNEYPTSTKIVLKNINDALTFNNFHEGIHFGIILSIKKLV